MYRHGLAIKGALSAFSVTDCLNRDEHINGIWPQLCPKQWRHFIARDFFLCTHFHPAGWLTHTCFPAGWRCSNCVLLLLCISKGGMLIHPYHISDISRVPGSPIFLDSGFTKDGCQPVHITRIHENQNPRKVLLVLFFLLLILLIRLEQNHLE